MPLWSDPTADPALDPAALQSGYHIPLSTDITPIVGDIIRQRMFQQQQAQQGLQEAGQAIQDYRNRQNADQVASSIAPTLGLSGDQASAVSDANHPAQALAALIAARQANATLAELNARAQMYQNHGNYFLGRANPSATPSVYGQPGVDPATGLVWNGRTWIRPPAAAAASQTSGLFRGDLTMGDNGVQTFAPNDSGSYVLTNTPQGKQGYMTVGDYNRAHPNAPLPVNTAPQPSPSPSPTQNQQPEQRVNVTGPNGITGTVTLSDSKNLPPGWTIAQ